MDQEGRQRLGQVVRELRKDLYIQALPEKARAHFNMLFSYGDEINQFVAEKSN